MTTEELLWNATFEVEPDPPEDDYYVLNRIRENYYNNKYPTNENNKDHLLYY